MIEKNKINIKVNDKITLTKMFKRKINNKHIDIIFESDKFEDIEGEIITFCFEKNIRTKTYHNIQIFFWYPENDLYYGTFYDTMDLASIKNGKIKSQNDKYLKSIISEEEIFSLIKKVEDYV